MEGLFGLDDIKALQNLISPPEESDSDDDLPQTGARKLGPGDLGGSKDLTTQTNNPHRPLKTDGEDDDDIWQRSEVTNAQSSQLSDPRTVPEYEIKFKQAVSAEDVFLGIGFKTPASASCEWLSISIKLPNELRENIELTVESQFIDVRSPKYRLYLPTPHPVDPDASSAKWHSDSSTLELILKLTRELDPINF